MTFDLITPTQMVASMPIKTVRIPGSDGQFGVLPGHMPLVSTLQEGGTLVAEDMDGVSHSFTITAGFADVRPDSVTILAEGLVGAAA